MTDARCRVCGRPNDHQHVGLNVRNPDIDPPPDCPNCPDSTVRILGHGPRGKTPPITPWCTNCGWRGDEVRPTRAVPVVDLRSLPNVPDGVMGKGTPIDPAALDALADGKVSYADD